MSACACARVIVLSEECRAGSAPPGEDDVMVDCFLFSEPVRQARSRLHGEKFCTCGLGFGSPFISTPDVPQNFAEF